MSELPSDIAAAKIRNFSGDEMPNASIVFLASGSINDPPFATQYVPSNTIEIGIDQSNPSSTPFFDVGDQLSFPFST